jgi:prepilin-type N-terminal cleavage/methylation domain-containing protein
MSDQRINSTERPRRPDAGFTLIELLVAMGLFGILATILLGLAISSSGVADDTRQLATVGDESRLGMERMTRELRQAARIADVVLPSSAGVGPTRFTLWADFDASGCIHNGTAPTPLPGEPEQITYTWDPSTRHLTLSAVIAGVRRNRLLLATKVSSFSLSLSSSSWQYDADQNGTTTWQEIDASSIGDQNPGNFTSAELERIDLVGLSITATDGSHDVDYATEVDLRNQSPDRQPIGVCA